MTKIDALVNEKTMRSLLNDRIVHCSGIVAKLKTKGGQKKREIEKFCIGCNEGAIIERERERERDGSTEQ